MPIVRLGNHAALHNGRVVPGQQVTTVHVPDVDSHHDRMRTITHPDGLWNAVSDHDSPAWVCCDDEELEAALAAHYGCRVGGPDDYLEHVDELKVLESLAPETRKGVQDQDQRR